MMQIVLAIVLLLHGLIHLLGFLVPWRLASLEEMPYRTTVLAGALDVGEGGIRVVGLLWLLAAMGLAVAASALFTLRPWWAAVTFGATIFSLALCVLGWPEARFGVLVNLAILGFLLVAGRMAWLGQ